MNSPIGTVVVNMSPRNAHASRARSQMWAPCIDGDRAGGGMRHRVPAQRIEQHGRAGGAMQQRRHELPLVDHPIQVGPRRGAGADVAERVAAVELLTAGGQVDAGERVADRFGRAHGHSADRVDHDGEAVEPDLGVVVEPDPGGLLDGLRQQRGTADGERRIDLVLAVAGDRHVGVPRDRHHRGRRARPDAGNVHQQDGVGAAVAHVVAGGQLGLLLGRQALAAVRADQQPGGALAGGGPLGVVGQRGDAVQRRVHPHAAGHHRDDEHQQERQHDAAPMSFAARLFRLRWRRRLVRLPVRAGGAAVPVGGGAAGAGRWRRAARGSLRVRWPRLGSRWRSVVRVTPDHLRRLPALPWGRDPGLRPVVVHRKESTTASRGGPRPTHSRRRRPSRSPRAR